jgi:hypothetical protein
LSAGGTKISGDEFTEDRAAGQIIITGNPRAERGTDVITATRMLVNQRTREFTAEGDVVINQAGQIFRTQRATYSFDTREGRVDAVRSRFGTWYTRTQELLLRPGPSYVGNHCFLSTCSREHAHWGLHPRKLTVYPNDKLIAEDVGFDLLGIRFFTIPRIVRSLKPGEEGGDNSSYPSIGYSNFYGPFIYDDFTLIAGRPVRLDANVQINTFHEPSGGLLVATPGRLQGVGTLFYRDSADNQRSRHLQVSRLPEVGLVWTNYPAARPGRFLANQISNVSYPGYLSVSRDWMFSGQISGGYFRQHHGTSTTQPDGASKNGARLGIQAQAVQPTVQLGPIRLNDFRLMARQNVYDSGDGYAVLGTGIGKRYRFGNWRLSIHRFDQFTVGHTPFLVDDVDLNEEWRPRLAFETRGFSFSYYARLSGQRFNPYDQVFSISKVFHCLEPRITYRVRNQQIGFELRILGLNGFKRTQPGRSRTQESAEDAEEALPPTTEGEPPTLRPY